MDQKQNILVVDDEEGARFLASHYLEQCGYKPYPAATGEEALQLLSKHVFAAVLADHLMPGMDGLELLKQVKDNYGDLPFIIMSAHGSIERAVILMKEGANDYIQKPLDPDVLEMTVRRSMNIHQLGEENRKLKEYVKDRFTFQSIVTQSPAMRKALILAEKAATSPLTTVAIYGESGTGKEMLARAIHFAAGGLPAQFVAVNCAGIPAGLLESELFGHVRGAFTGADKDRQGKFDLAQGGTLLLDEIGDMPLEIQSKLLRVLEERSFEKVGSNKRIPLNAKVIVATHRNLEQLVEQDIFREDLYYRVNIFPITVPSLRERSADIPLLVQHFFDTFRHHIGKRLPGITKPAMTLLSTYPWPGNIRELKNCIERATILAGDEFITPEHLIINNLVTAQQTPRKASGRLFEISLSDADLSLDAIIEQALQLARERCDNNLSQAAKLLKIDRKMFYRRN